METENDKKVKPGPRRASAHGSALAEVLEIAAALLVGREMPSIYIEDWDISKTTPMKTRKEIVKAAEKCREQRRQWSIRLISAYDVLNKPNDPAHRPAREQQ